MLNSTHTQTKIEAGKKGDKQCRIWKNNGKFQKQNRCKTCKQQKRLFELD